MKRARRRQDALFVDTNLLLLLIAGSVGEDKIEQFRRARSYSQDDFRLLRSFVGGFRRMLTTPNVLTEVSNLAGQSPEPLRTKALLLLGALTGRFEEEHHPSSELVSLPAYPILGLADSSIFATATRQVTVLTDDLELYSRLSAAGVHAINFSHVRSGSW